MQRRLVRAIGGSALLMGAGTFSFEFVRRQRRREARQIVLRHCIVKAGSDGQAAARALDEHGCCVILGAMPGRLSDRMQPKGFQDKVQSLFSQIADKLDPAAAAAAASAAAAMLIPSVHVGDGHLTRHRAALGAQLAERAAIGRLCSQAPSIAGCAQAVMALWPLMQEVDERLVGNPFSTHCGPLKLDLYSWDDDRTMSAIGADEQAPTLGLAELSSEQHVELADLEEKASQLLAEADSGMGDAVDKMSEEVDRQVNTDVRSIFAGSGALLSTQVEFHNGEVDMSPDSSAAIPLGGLSSGPRSVLSHGWASVLLAPSAAWKTVLDQTCMRRREALMQRHVQLLAFAHPANVQGPVRAESESEVAALREPRPSVDAIPSKARGDEGTVATATHEQADGECPRWDEWVRRVEQMSAHAQRSKESWRPSVGEHSVVVLMPLGFSSTSIEILPAPRLLLEPMQLTLPVGSVLVLDGITRWRLPPMVESNAADPFARALVQFEYAVLPSSVHDPGSEIWRMVKKWRTMTMDAILSAAAAAACFGDGVMQVRIDDEEV